MRSHNNKNIILTILAVGLLAGGTLLAVNADQDLDKKKSLEIEATQRNEINQAESAPSSELLVLSDELVDAIMSNDLEKVLELITEKKVDVNQANSEGIYPLEAILVLDNVEMAEFLLKNGADPDIVTQEGKTIKERVMSGNSKMLKELFSEY